jgi:hypothetical protein
MSGTRVTTIHALATCTAHLSRDLANFIAGNSANADYRIIHITTIDERYRCVCGKQGRWFIRQVERNDP